MRQKRGSWPIVWPRTLLLCCAMDYWVCCSCHMLLVNSPSSKPPPVLRQPRRWISETSSSVVPSKYSTKVDHTQSLRVDFSSPRFRSASLGLTEELFACHPEPASASEPCRRISAKRLI